MQCLQVYQQLVFVLVMHVTISTRVDPILQTFAAANTLVVKTGVKPTFNKHITSSLINKKDFTQKNIF